MKNSKFLRSKNLLKSLEAEELKSLNDERQEKKDNGNIDSVSERYRSHGMTGGTERCPTKTHAQHLGHDGQGGFTLVELVITIAIVIILSVISVPIYQGYTRKAKMAEGYALLGTILSAQKAYYSEYGNFLGEEAYHEEGTPGNWLTYDPILGIDARGNKYCTAFYPAGNYGQGITYFSAGVLLVDELRENGNVKLKLQYNITTGAKFVEVNRENG